MTWKRRITAATAILGMVMPKLLDELNDLLDGDPATLFSWKFMLALMAGPVLAAVLATSPRRT